MPKNESGMGYGNWFHGEAVAAGTMLAADVFQASWVGWITTQMTRISSLFVKADCLSMPLIRD